MLCHSLIIIVHVNIVHIYSAVENYAQFQLILKQNTTHFLINYLLWSKIIF